MVNGSLLRLKFLVLLCVSVLLICGSLSILCPMTMISAEAASHPVHHAMEGEGECFEALVSSSSLAGELNGYVLLPETPHSECLGGQAVQPVLDTFQTDPHIEGPPRYLLLSTFLI